VTERAANDSFLEAFTALVQHGDFLVFLGAPKSSVEAELQVKSGALQSIVRVFVPGRQLYADVCGRRRVTESVPSFCQSYYYYHWQS
jgi:hypothetical protein